jgi:biotin synthase
MTDRELRELVVAEGPAAEELRAEADRVRRETVGDDVYLRGIIEFSSHCRCDCEYCGLRQSNSALARFRLSPAQVVAACREITGLGFGTAVLQSGEDTWWSAARVADLVREIKRQTPLAITLSLGERATADYRRWREAGADRYLLKHETANRALYQRLHPGASYDQRLACQDALFALGYQVGSGCIIGLPGQTPDLLVEDLRLIEARCYHMCGVGPLIPHPATPLGALPVGSVEITLNMMALARLLVPDVMLPATTALETARPGARLQASAAANPAPRGRTDRGDCARRRPFGGAGGRPQPPRWGNSLKLISRRVVQHRPGRPPGTQNCRSETRNQVVIRIVLCYRVILREESQPLQTSHRETWTPVSGAELEPPPSIG